MSYQQIITAENLYEDNAGRERVKLVAITTAILNGSYIMAHQLSDAKVSGIDCVKYAEQQVMKEFYPS
jgi:hypothetical protein